MSDFYATFFSAYGWAPAPPHSEVAACRVGAMDNHGGASRARSAATTPISPQTS
jgi:hypothetical protein